MAFDMGFNFRSTAGYVTDQAYAVPVLEEAYPHTYTNVNGFSINAGWTVGSLASANRNSGNDPRIAGINYSGGTGTVTFAIDLSSGSAPGAGVYTLDAAFGDTASNTQEWVVKDNVTSLIATGVVVTAAGHYLDATLVDRTASTTWAGATTNKTFASTTCNIVGNGAGGTGFCTIAHFRLALATVAGLSIPVAMRHYRQRRN